MAILSQTDRDTLEAMIDRCDLREVLLSLVQICTEKADHIRENWQDEALAKGWERDARRVLDCSEALD